MSPLPDGRNLPVEQPKKLRRKNNSGRKLFDGKSEEIVNQKLDQVWAMGGTDAEAAFYAEISLTALNVYLKDKSEVSARRDALKNKPILKARTTIVTALDDPAHAWRFLEHKRADEFGNRPQSPGVEVNISFTQELERREKKYEPEPIDVTAKVQTPDVQGVAGGSEALLAGTGDPIHQTDAPAQVEPAHFRSAILPTHHPGRDGSS